MHEFHIAVHVGVLEEVTFLNEPPFRYFILKILLTGCFLFMYSCQFSLPLNAKLSRIGSRICNPPSKIGRLSTSQLTKCILFWPPLPPFQRKSLNSLEIWAEIDFGDSNREDWKIGKAKSIDLIKINFPDLVNH